MVHHNQSPSTLANRIAGHKYLPQLDGWIETEDGQKGWTTEFFAESPFADRSVKPVTTYVLPSTRVRVNDQKPPGEFTPPKQDVG
jgi:hypothetical protein